MPRNISDEEYQYLQGRRQVADFVESIYNNPKYTKQAKRLIKEAYPNMSIPDLDIEDRVEARFAEEQKRRDEEEATKRQQDEQTHWQSKRAATQKQYGFTDEAMEDLEKMMVDRNIGDYEVAASYKAARDPKPTDRDFNAGRWDYEKAAGFQEIAKDPEGWGRNEILRAIYADQERERGNR